MTSGYSRDWGMWINRPFHIVSLLVTDSSKRGGSTGSTACDETLRGKKGVGYRGC
jgi:hypothetical protein